MATAASSAPFGTSYNVTTPGRVVAGRQLEEPSPYEQKSKRNEPQTQNDNYQNHVLPTKPDLNAKYAALPPISQQQHHGRRGPSQQSKGRPSSNTSDTDGSVFSQAKSYASNVIISQIKLASPQAVSDFENRVRKLQHDRRDCLEREDVLRACRHSGVRLSAPEFTALLKQFDQFGNGTVPAAKMTGLFDTVRNGGRMDLYPVPEQYPAPGEPAEPSNALQQSRKARQLRSERQLDNHDAASSSSRNPGPSQTAKHSEQVHAHKQNGGFVPRSFDELQNTRPHNYSYSPNVSPNRSQPQQVQYTNPTPQVQQPLYQRTQVYDSVVPPPSLKMDPNLQAAMVGRIAQLQSNRLALEKQRETIRAMMSSSRY